MDGYFILIFYFFNTPQITHYKTISNLLGIYVLVYTKPEPHTQPEVMFLDVVLMALFYPFERTHE